MLSTRTSSARSLSADSLVLAAGIAGCIAAQSAGAAAIVWNNALNNNVFTAGGNWVGGTAPGAADEAIINIANAAPLLVANYTIDTLTLKDIASASLIVQSKKLTVGTLTNVAKGNLRVQGSNAGPAVLEAKGTGIVVDAGQLTLEAPASAGEAKVVCAVSEGFQIKATGTVQVAEGAGGLRTFNTDVVNAGNFNIDQNATISGATAGGDVIVKNTGNLKVKAGKSLVVTGSDLDISQFQMSAGKVIDGGGISLNNLNFVYSGGDWRNATDTGTGGVSLKGCVFNLNTTNPIFMTVNGTGSIAGTGLPGAGQNLSWNSAGDNAPTLGYVGTFTNKGSVKFNTGGSVMTFAGTGAAMVNAGTMELNDNGKVVVQGLVGNRPGATMKINADADFLVPAAIPAANNAYNAGTITFTRNGATLTTNRKFQNSSKEGVPLTNKKGTIQVSDPKTVKAIIKTGNRADGNKTVGGDVKTGVNINPRPAAAPTSTDPGSSTVRGATSTFVPTITFLGGYAQEADSVWDTAIWGDSPSSFTAGTLGIYDGDCVLGGTMTLSLVGYEPTAGMRFTMIASDAPVLGQFDFGDTLYPSGGSGSIFFHVLYNDPTNLDSPFNVTLVADTMVPAPGAASLSGLAGLIALRRRR